MSSTTQKVISWNNDGNSCSKKTKKLTQFHDNIYLYDADGNGFTIVIEVEGIYVEASTNQMWVIENNLEKLKQIAADYPSFILNKDYPTVVDLELFNQLGRDCDELLAKRAKKKEENRLKAEQRKKEDEIRKAQAQKRWDEKIKDAGELFLNGELIECDMLEELFKKYGVSVPARTIGGMRNHGISLNNGRLVKYHSYGTPSKAFMRRCADFAKELYQKMIKI